MKKGRKCVVHEEDCILNARNTQLNLDTTMSWLDIYFQTLESNPIVNLNSKENKKVYKKCTPGTSKFSPSDIVVHLPICIQDNAAGHSAKVLMQFLELGNTVVMTRPVKDLA